MTRWIAVKIVLFAVWLAQKFGYRDPVAPRTADAVLKGIDAAFVTMPSDEVRMLWDVLTALRGPDPLDMQLSLKDETTGLVRSLAFPRLRNDERFLLATITRNTADAERRMRDASNKGSIPAPAGFYHFTAHVHAARIALSAMGRFA